MEACRIQPEVSLKHFHYNFEFVRMKPDQGVLKGGLPPKSRVRVLFEAGKQYALYAFGGPEVKLSLALPVGKFKPSGSAQ
ncbi:MAG TPA: hypothetical protein VG122_13360 [Gemmata sp.]|nr:hypothetical protein [Gemmata sp.]